MAYQFTDRLTHLPRTAGELARRFEDDHWWMSDAERLALHGIVSELRPACAIEVGVYRAGSLGILSRFCGKVYALDIDPECEAQFSKQFDNVEFVTGASDVTLPQVLARIEAAGGELGFVLIDASHSREGVLRDIDHVLSYTPSRPMYVLVHDSFNPGCRSGIREASWSRNRMFISWNSTLFRDGISTMRSPTRSNRCGADWRWRFFCRNRDAALSRSTPTNRLHSRR